MDQKRAIFHKVAFIFKYNDEFIHLTFSTPKHSMYKYNFERKYCSTKIPACSRGLGLAMYYISDVGCM